MSAENLDRANPIERARLTGNPNSARVVMEVPRCTCTTNAMPSAAGGIYYCPCGWLSGNALDGWVLRIRDELDYLGEQE